MNCRNVLSEVLKWGCGYLVNCQQDIELALIADECQLLDNVFAGHWVWSAPKTVDCDALILYITYNLVSIITDIFKEKALPKLPIFFPAVKHAL